MMAEKWLEDDGVLQVPEIPKSCTRILPFLTH
jgi:hypothetical protein